MLLSTDPFETERQYRGSLPSPAPSSILLHRLFRSPHLGAYYRTDSTINNITLHHHLLMLVHSTITLETPLTYDNIYRKTISAGLIEVVSLHRTCHPDALS
ncbi:uncharacterized protein AKAW2_10728S [Aspergillus luchuensis]|uniref:Uncharacterized protein n=1 Tax=Aspergillus kawachii TaxID=1069201 RepID=A0A7R7VZL6_ASPKA|nr:uncharacterized protein AKAW2_10728S [Aspergillus luchuensis]BCR93682.1 hypothetical protein AKAW2_10728S [Aspergillus luchuensis]